jgi:mitogen-activated protein kinase kinase 1
MPPFGLKVAVPLEEDMPQRTWSLSDTGTFAEGDFSFKMKKLGHGNVAIQDVLGRGAGGIVRRAVHQQSEVQMACKIIEVHDETARSLVNELRSIDACSHDHLVQFFGAYFLDHSVYLLCELMDGGCCQAFLRRSGGNLAEEVVASIAHDVIEALAYLQVERHMVHRDVKPGNILFRPDGTCKLGDYGILKDLQVTDAWSSTFCGTAAYMSPERVESSDYTYNSDVWSVGVVVFEAITGLYPFVCQ